MYKIFLPDHCSKNAGVYNRFENYRLAEKNLHKYLEGFKILEVSGCEMYEKRKWQLGF